jgi:hypothetical protein
MAHISKAGDRQPDPKAHGILHATMREVEPGLFQADYPGEMNGEDKPSGGQFPDRHIATSRQDVQTWVETMTTQLGYERVEWD